MKSLIKAALVTSVLGLTSRGPRQVDDKIRTHKTKILKERKKAKEQLELL